LHTSRPNCTSHHADARRHRATGSAFTFRTYDSARDVVQRRWGRIFSVASVATPVLLGLCLGAVASGRVPMRAAVSAEAARAMLASTTFNERFILPWLASPFAWAVGLFALALFAFLAATYLTLEARDPALQDVRRRALQSQGALLCIGLATIALAASDAPLVFQGLTQGSVALGMHAVTALRPSRRSSRYGRARSSGRDWPPWRRPASSSGDGRGRNSLAAATRTAASRSWRRRG
jgi:hypothetical protein